MFQNDDYSQIMLDDIKTLSVQAIQEKYYQISEKDYEYSYEDGYLNIPFMDKISCLDFSRELTYDYYVNYGGEDNYGDAIYYLETSPLFEIGNDNYLCNGDVTTINTYNYESYLSRILQFSYAYDELNQRYVVCLEVHDGVSDARVGYSHIFFYTTEYLEDFLLNLECCTISIDNLKTLFYISGDECNMYAEGVCDEYIDTWKLLECLEHINNNKIHVN